MNSKEFVALIKRETKEIVEELGNLNKLWEDFDSKKYNDNSDNQKKYNLCSSFYFYLKEIVIICQEGVETLNFVLQELEIAKSNRNIDGNTIFEINNETEKLSGVFKRVKKKEDAMITQIELYLQELKSQNEAEKSKNIFSSLNQKGKRSQKKIYEPSIGLVVNSSSQPHVSVPLENVHVSNDKSLIRSPTPSENDTSIITKIGSSFTQVVLWSVPNYFRPKHNVNIIVKDRIQLKKDLDTLEALVSQIKDLSIKFDKFSDVIDNAAGILLNLVSNIEASKLQSMQQFDEERKPNFGATIEFQAENMINITKLLQNSFKSIEGESQKNVVPTRFISC